MNPYFSRIFVLIIFTFLAMNSGYCFAEDKTLCLTADSQFTYAMTLHDEKNHTLAQVEFSRFLHFFPDDSRAPQILFTLGLSQFENGELALAKDSFEKLMNDESSGVWGIESYFMTARYHKETGNPILAEINLRNLITLTDNTATKDRAYNAIAWLRLETAQWNHAAALFSHISPAAKEQYRVETILSSLEHTAEIPQKNPILAGTLSIVPGAGYLYCGRPRDALVSFLLNGGIIYAAYEAFDREQYALGSVISFVGFGFYAGNIYGSASSAHKYNRSANRAFIHRIKQDTQAPLTLGLWQSPGKPPGLAIQMIF